MMGGLQGRSTRSSTRSGVRRVDFLVGWGGTPPRGLTEALWTASAGPSAHANKGQTMADTPPLNRLAALVAKTTAVAGGRRAAPGATPPPVAPVVQAKREMPAAKMPAPIPKPAPPPPAPISAEPDKKKRKTAPNSKKHSIGKLPKDWRQKMWAASGAPGKGRAKNGMSPKFRQALAVVQLTGCRPSELEKGILIGLTDDGKIWIHIEGSKTGMVTVDLPGKVGKTQVPRGIEARQLVIDPAISPAAEYLAQAVAVANDNISAQYDADGFRSKINSLGRQALGDRRATTVSPYSYRHAMGCDLKSCDTLTDAAMSSIMGHRSLESLARYGKRRRGGGGPSPVVEVLVSTQPHGQRQRGGAPAEAAPAEVARPG